MLSAIVRAFGCVAICSRIAESGGTFLRDRAESADGGVVERARAVSRLSAESGIVPLDTRPESIGVVP
jgi:hypothetical protein